MVTAAQGLVSDTRFSVLEMSTHARLREDFVPKDFTELYQHYWTYVLKEVVSAGIDAQDAEDVAHTLLTTFYQKKILEDFNPEYTSTHDGITRKAVFRTFLSGFLRIYLRHYRTKQAKLHSREGVSIDVVVMEDEYGEPISWIDVNGPEVYDSHGSLEYAALVDSIRKHLASVTPRSPQDRCNLPELFDAIESQLHERDKIDVASLAEAFSVSKTSIQNWIKRLRDELAEILES